MDEFLGVTGKWHWPVMVINAYVAIPQAWFTMAPSFMEPGKLKYWCTPPENVTFEVWQQQNPNVDLNCSAIYNGTLTKCSQWQFVTTEMHRPMQMDFGTVCDDEGLTSVHKSLIMAGLMVGNFVFSHLSDWFGRKPILLLCVLFQIIFNMLLLFSPSYAWILAATFVAASGYGGLQNIPFTLAMESVGSSQRAFVSTCEEIGWILGIMTLPICTYFVRDWRFLQVCVIFPLLVTFTVWCFCDESPRWLLINKKTEEARKLLLRIGKKNGIENAEAKVNRILDDRKQETKDGKASVLDFFRDWNIAKMIITFYIQFACSILLYFTLIYFIVDVGSNPHLNLFISGVLELPLLPIAYFSLRKLHRKTLYLFTHLPSLVAILTLAFLPEGFTYVELGLATVAKWASQILFTLLVVHVAECFPTEVRALAVGTSMTMSRIGAIISPFMKNLGTRWSCLFCAVTIVVAYLTSLCLPETSTSTLPDTLRETCRKLKEVKSGPPSPPKIEENVSQDS